MMLIVWIVVGAAALLYLAVLGFGLFGQVKRLLDAFADARSAVAPDVAELNEGIRKAQTLRMQSAEQQGASPSPRLVGVDPVETTRGYGRHA